MIQYRKWYKPIVYNQVEKIGEPPKSFVKNVVCDGWYLFRIPLYTRENV